MVSLSSRYLVGNCQQGRRFVPEIFNKIAAAISWAMLRSKEQIQTSWRLEVSLPPLIVPREVMTAERRDPVHAEEEPI
jgi:hypothetical protein